VVDAWVKLVVVVGGWVILVVVEIVVVGSVVGGFELEKVAVVV